MTDFEDEVMEAEASHIEEIKNQKDTISRLRTELLNLNNTNKELQSKISSHIENTEKLSLQMKELEEINSNMCCTIQLLEEENRVSAQEIKRLEDKQDGRSRVEGNEEIIEISGKYTTADVTCDDAPTLADRLRIPSNIGSITYTTESGSGTTNTQKLTRILTVGDELARNSSAILNSYVSSDVTVEGIVKPGVEFCDLVIPLFHQSMHLESFMVMVEWGFMLGEEFASVTFLVYQLKKSLNLL
nr:unnamed protein product [Callosobruchus chinensis]